MRGPLRVALLLFAAIALLLFLFRGPIALRVVRAALERNMTADFVAELPEGLHVILCGAGGPLPDPVRSGPCVAVVAGETLLVVDAGSGTARNLAQMRLPPARVEALLLTHFHSDHIDGLGELALQRWAGGAHEAPLPVIGPAGVEEVVAGLNRAYRIDADYRIAHHGAETVPPTGTGMLAQPFAAPGPGEERVIWERDGLRVAAFSVDHAPVIPAVGYRFDYRGRSVVVSGDTKKSEELLRVAQDVDLLVHEALSNRLVALINSAAHSAGRDNLAKITSDIPDYHTTPLEAAELAEAAGAQHLLYYHVVPPLPVPGLEGIFLEGVSDAYSGGVSLGRDGTMISLPSGSDAIELSER